MTNDHVLFAHRPRVLASARERGTGGRGGGAHAGRRLSARRRRAGLRDGCRPRCRRRRSRCPAPVLRRLALLERLGDHGERVRLIRGDALRRFGRDLRGALHQVSEPCRLGRLDGPDQGVGGGDL